jgi:uncharacterized protein with GYD domain
MFGRYDVVVVLEFSGDEQMLALALGQATRGDTRSQILNAFPPDEVEPILARLP